MPEKQEFKPITSRELADKVNELIAVNFYIMTLRQIPLQSTTDPISELKEQRELLIRQVADAFKRLDHNPGFAVTAKTD